MLGLNEKKIQVEFIGREPWYDHLYRTELTFNPGQVREMPEHYARKFLHHIDMFRQVQKIDAAAQDQENQDQENQDQENQDQENQDQENQDQDDTSAILANSEAKASEENELQKNNQILDTLAQINDMSQPALIDFAMERYNVKIAKRTKADDVRAEVTNLVNQYGVL